MTVFIVAVFFIMFIAPLGDGYVEDPQESCGDADTPCHGVPDPEVEVIIDGPDIVKTDESVTYAITVLGGPSKTYGYFVYFTDPDGNSRNIEGDFLFEVDPNSVIRIRDSNTFLVEFTPPRNAVHLKMRAVAVSADDSGSPLGDGWNFAEMDVGVEYPSSVDFPGLDISSSAHLIGAVVLTIGFAMWAVFTVLDRKVKKEVSRTGRREERGN
jgi:hypothetical protein